MSSLATLQHIFQAPQADLILTMTHREKGPSRTLSKELLIGRIESGRRLAQVVVTIRDEVGSVASVNALIATLNVDIRQSTSYSLPVDSLAIYNAFVVFNDPKISLIQLVERLEESPHVVKVEAHEGRDGVIVDGISFPVNWQGRRTVILSQPATTRMFEAMRFSLGSGGEVILYQQGYSYGKELAEFFVARLGTDYLSRNFEYAMRILAATGWGVPEFVGSGANFPDMTVSMLSCFECEGARTSQPICCFMRGFLSGVSSTIAGHKIHCEESRCIAKGDARCEFNLRSGRSTITR